MTEVETLAGMGACYLRVFRYGETLSEFSRRTGISTMRLSHIETNHGEPCTEKEAKILNKTRKEWKRVDKEPTE